MDQTLESNASHNETAINRPSQTNLLNLNSSNSLVQAVLDTCSDCGQDPCECQSHALNTTFICLGTSIYNKDIRTYARIRNYTPLVGVNGR